MKISYIGATIIGLASMALINVHAADAKAGQEKSVACAGCHGVDGNSVNPIWPRLAGQHASYLVKQMKDFKVGNRVDSTMQAMVAALSDSDIADIAAYYASQKPATASFDASLLAQGENIYRGGISETSVAACMGCHSPSGKGNGPAAYPSLNGQHAEYITIQLSKFKDGSRANDAGKMMRNVANRMSDKEMKSVSAYVAGLK